MNWPKTTAIIALIAMLLAGVNAALSIREHIKKNAA